MPISGSNAAPGPMPSKQPIASCRSSIDLAGGDRAQFERIKRAFKILSHPERRKVYDETGQAEEAQADNAEALARTVLAQVFRKIIAERADWIFHIDVVGEMETEIKHTIKSNKTEAQKARSRTRT